MQKFNWIETITPNLFLLRCVGLWPEKNQLYGRHWYTLYAGFNAVVIIAFHNLSQFINIFFVYSDLEVLTATIFVLITNILATGKMYVFAKSLKLIKHLFVVLNEDPFQPKSNQIGIIQPSLKRYKILFYIFHTIVICNIFLWSIAPFLDPNLKLPFVAWYPFDITVFPNYQFVYCYQVICIWYITIANLSLDCFIDAILMYICVQCDLLCDNLENLKGSEIEFKLSFVKCVRHHKELVRFAKTSNDLFNYLILGQFGTSTMVLALTMFQLTLVDPISQGAFTNFNYFLGISTQLFLYCWFGNDVELKSSEFPYALYKSDWFEQPISVRRSMLIFSERCRKSLRITAIDLFALSLRTFVAILRSAWSYFAVLYSVNNA